KIKTAIRADVSVARACANAAADGFQFQAAVAATELEFAFQSCNAYASVACTKIHFAFSRHVDIDLDMITTEVEEVSLARKSNFDLNLVAVLPLVDLDAAFPDFVVLCRYLRFDRILVPSIDVDLRVGALDLQVRAATERVGFGPLVGMGQRNGHGEQQQQSE